MNTIIFRNYELRKFSNALYRTFSLTADKRQRLTLLTEGFIDGEWVPAKSGNTFEVINPATTEVLGSVPDMDVEDTQAAISAAREAFQTWGSTTALERAGVLRRWYCLMEKEAKSLAALITAEGGKPVPQALGEVHSGNSYIQWFSEEARRIYGQVIQSPVLDREIVVVRQPIGVVALISPWNFPHAMIARKAGAALAAGCTCVIKPAELTPFTALYMARLAEQAGMPRGVLNVVTASQDRTPAVGEELCTNPQVAGLSFTGSTAVGKLLYRQCAGGVKRLSLELGGDAPFIVFDSADLTRAVHGAVASKFRHSGQTCVSANRFLIQDSVFDQFVRQLKDRMATLKMGDGSKPDVVLGPLISVKQVERVERIVQDAVDRGATVVMGGKRATELGPHFYQPTLLTKVPPSMEELFGPVAGCTSFSTEEEAVAAANDTARGLAGYLYTRSLGQAWRVSRRLEVGMVGVNEAVITCPEAPFGGTKESGFGREGSRFAVDSYSYIKYISFGDLHAS